MKSKFLDNGFSLKSGRCGNELMNEARLKKDKFITDSKQQHKIIELNSKRCLIPA